MKQAVIVLMVLVGAAVAQEGQTAQAVNIPAKTNLVTRMQAPTYSDLNCAGHIAEKMFPKNPMVVGGLDTPHQTRFVSGNYVYLSGSGFEEGAVYSLVRHQEDPDRYEIFPGQHAMLRRAGYLYADIGRVRVVQVNGNLAVSVVEFTCDNIMPGDVAVPFAERPQVNFRHGVVFDRFARPNGKLTGQIIMAKEFDNFVGTGNKVYLNVGADQGVKPGDYFRITRSYRKARRTEVDAISYHGIPDIGETYDPGRLAMQHLNELPRVSLGELVVLSVTPKNATGMVTMALEDMHIGDGVELEETLPEPAAGTSSSAPASAASANPPRISCFAKPVRVRPGENSTVTCEASSDDNRPLSFSFVSDRGSLMARDNLAVLETHNMAAGPVAVTATVMDDRNLLASASANVEVEPEAAAPAASKLTNISFQRNSAYVNNVSKAVLDDVALRLQQDSGSSAVIVGSSGSGEAQKLSEKRAENARIYLIRNKGIDAKRVMVQQSSRGNGNSEIWWVPAGAQLPENP